MRWDVSGQWGHRRRVQAGQRGVPDGQRGLVCLDVSRPRGSDAFPGGPIKSAPRTRAPSTPAATSPPRSVCGGGGEGLACLDMCQTARPGGPTTHLRAQRQRDFALFLEDFFVRADARPQPAQRIRRTDHHGIADLQCLLLRLLNRVGSRGLGNLLANLRQLRVENLAVLRRDHRLHRRAHHLWHPHTRTAHRRDVSHGAG